MSDLRLEDLVVPNPNIEGDYYPVTRVEVLEALGAERVWVCRRPQVRRGPCMDRAGFIVHDDLDLDQVKAVHGQCGWRWVVTDAT